ncbi:DUF6706 family protein [Sphingobacterium psychroaquaticum]|uniref:Uncharacterized protein n=1 Tax=Sphingobacterium psychroaquaticum TaxID=561061 RepID=A0A1X7JUU8_9SPHI|nr:DUF6706 family protein [Sphingobacterium psychroaquaticum]SMG32203.1 hypothetical protein SAMN05660862_2238 [Sphingobacterium psychroaquaticum]
MTNREALLSDISIRVKPNSVTKVLIDQGVNPDGEYLPQDEQCRRGVDLALAALILVLSLSPESVKELDYQLTSRSIEGLLKIRKGILKRWGVEDEMDDSATITSISDLW